MYIHRIMEQLNFRQKQQSNVDFAEKLLYDFL